MLFLLFLLLNTAVVTKEVVALRDKRVASRAVAEIGGTGEVARGVRGCNSHEVKSKQPKCTVKVQCTFAFGGWTIKCCSTSVGSRRFVFQLMLRPADLF